MLLATIQPIDAAFTILFVLYLGYALRDHYKGIFAQFQSVRVITISLPDKTEVKVALIQFAVTPNFAEGVREQYFNSPYLLAGSKTFDLLIKHVDLSLLPDHMFAVGPQIDSKYPSDMGVIYFAESQTARRVLLEPDVMPDSGGIPLRDLYDKTVWVMITADH